MTAPLSVLCLADLRRESANTIRDHIQSFTLHSQHKFYYFDPLGMQGSKLLNLEEFDVVVLHYSLYILSDYYLHGEFKKKLAAYKGLKVFYIQDDYRSIDRMSAVMREIGVNVLFTLCPADRMKKVWTDERLPGVKVYQTLAGYVPDNLIGVQTPRLRDRPLDIGYRSRAIPYWIGALGQEKTQIVERFLNAVRGKQVAYDVSCREQDRIYGPAWPKFIMSCKAMLGTESGSSITDFDDSAERLTRQYLARHPQATYVEVHEAILHRYEKNVVMNVISPRQFETAALRTALILHPGEYCGILKPWQHYIPLEKDFSNFDEVIEKVNDMDFLEELTERTYEEIIASRKYSGATLAKAFDDVVDENVATRRGRIKLGYCMASMAAIANKGKWGNSPVNYSGVTKWLRFFAALPFLLYHKLVLKPTRLLIKALDFSYATLSLLRRAWTRRLLMRSMLRVSPKRLPWAMKDLVILKNVVDRTLFCVRCPNIGDIGFYATLDESSRALQFHALPFSAGQTSQPRALELLTRLTAALSAGEVRSLEFRHQEIGTHIGLRSWFGKRFTFSLGEGDVLRFEFLQKLYPSYVSISIETKPVEKDTSSEMSDMKMRGRAYPAVDASFDKKQTAAAA